MINLLRTLHPAEIRQITRSAIEHLRWRVERELELPAADHAAVADRLLLQIRLAYGAWGEQADETERQERECYSWQELG